MSKVAISSFAKWNPKTYLNEFYGTRVDFDEIATFAFLSDLAKKIKPGQKILEFGCGPTIFRIFPFAPFISEAHLADFLKPNLVEVRKWLNNEKDAHDWDKFVAYVLKLEGKKPTKKDIEDRKKQTKEKITKIMQGDARKADPLGKKLRKYYPVVMSCYCADSATSNHGDFKKFVRNIVSLLQPGGMFITACLRKASYYSSGDLYFPSANVDEKVLRDILELDFIEKSIKIKIKKLPSHVDQGYTSILLAYAKKK